jgi:hypothetical protein
LSQQCPGPNKYKINMDSIEPKSKCAAIFSPKLKEDYKPRKVRTPGGPGVAQYKYEDRNYVLAEHTQAANYSFFK